MKFLAIILLLASEVALAASDCEATIEIGQHKGANKEATIEAAWEEAVDSCYPGKAQKLNAFCEQYNTKNESAGYICKQEVTCTICGDDLVRKYEALD